MERRQSGTAARLGHEQGRAATDRNAGALRNRSGRRKLSDVQSSNSPGSLAASKRGTRSAGSATSLRERSIGRSKNSGGGDLLGEPGVFGPDQIEHQRRLLSVRQHLSAALDGAFGQPPLLRQRHELSEMAERTGLLGGWNARQFGAMAQPVETGEQWQWRNPRSRCR